jgi:hypothetical protein
VAKQRPRSDSAGPATGDQQPEVPEVERQADAAPGGPTAVLVDAVRVCYERELRLRRISRKAKSATDKALLEAVRATVEYARLARAVVPPTKNGDDIAGVRRQRQQVAARFRKRVERADKRHASLLAEATRPLPDAPPEAKDVVMESRKPLYVRESYYSHDVLPPDVARPAQADDEDNDDEVEAELEGPDLGDDYEDDDEDDEFEG